MDKLNRLYKSQNDEQRKINGDIELTCKELQESIGTNKQSILKVVKDKNETISNQVQSIEGTVTKQMEKLSRDIDKTKYDLLD
jgi:hypothetical protein